VCCNLDEEKECHDRSPEGDTCGLSFATRRPDRGYEERIKQRGTYSGTKSYATQRACFDFPSGVRKLVELEARRTSSSSANNSLRAESMVEDCNIDAS
jgi:hypothetical protein